MSEQQSDSKNDSVSSSKSSLSQSLRSPLEICIDEIEDDQAPTIFENSDQISSSTGLKKKPHQMLGKRLGKTVDEQWQEMMSGSDQDMCLRTAVPNGSLLGASLKRQRINSANSKFEFSFKPTGKSDLLKTNTKDPESAIGEKVKPFSFKPTTISSPPLRPRDMKASDKLDFCLSDMTKRSGPSVVNVIVPNLLDNLRLNNNDGSSWRDQSIKVKSQ